MGLKSSCPRIRDMYSTTLEQLSLTAHEKTFTIWTSMLPASDPGSGRYTGEEHVDDLFQAIITHTQGGGDSYLQENVYRLGSRYCKAVLDLDDYSSAELKDAKKAMKRWAKTWEAGNYSFFLHCNDKHEKKAHLYLLRDGEHVSVHRDSFTLFKSDLSKVLPSVDVNSGLRLPGCTKKEGRHTGIYPLDEPTVKRMKQLSPGYWHESYLLTNPDLEYTMLTATCNQAEKVAHKTTNLNAEQRHDRITHFLPAIREAGYLNRYDTWFKVAAACHAEEYPPELLEVECALAANYTEGCVHQKYKELDSSTASKKARFGTLYHLFISSVGEDEVKRYRELFVRVNEGGGWVPKDWLTWRWDEEVGFGKIWVDMRKANVKVVDLEKGVIYAYEEEEALWRKWTRSVCGTIANDDLEVFMKGMVERDTEDDTEEGRERLKATKHWLKRVQNIKLGKNVYTYAEKRLHSRTFRSKLNNRRSLLPITGCRVIDLRTGDVRERRAEDCFTFECPVGTGGNANDVDVCHFFRSIMSGNEDKYEYLQRVLGYCLTGSTKEKAFFVGHGRGHNGKSALLNLISKVLGEYSHAASEAVVSRSRMADRHVGACTPHLPGLDGARLAHISEGSSELRFNENLIKQLTGGDPITVNPKGKSQYSFIPQCKLFMGVNDLPQGEWSDMAMRDRVRYISFDTVFVHDPKQDHEAKRDPELVERLMTVKLDDVFAWMLEGASRYYQYGLHEPECMVQRKAEMVEEEDFIGGFFTECIEDGGDGVTITAAYEVYEGWCDYQHPLPKRSFIKECRRRHTVARRTTKPKVLQICGVTLAPTEVRSPKEPDFVGHL